MENSGDSEKIGVRGAMNLFVNRDSPYEVETVAWLSMLTSR